MRRKALYTLTAGDEKLLLAGKENPNKLNDFYLRTKSTGTWWLPGATREPWRTGYNNILSAWKQSGRAQQFVMQGVLYRAVQDHERSREHPNLPAFHHNHGTLLFPYGVELFHDRTPIRIILGGFGSAKSTNVAIDLLDKAVLIPEFRAFVLGPYTNQAAEIYKIIRNLTYNTLYAERFIINMVEKPQPKITIGHSGVGENSIEFFPIADEEALRNLTGDMAVIEQAEAQNIDLDELIRSVGTRLRGRTLTGGRARIGTLTLVANAGQNQRLWDLLEIAQEGSKDYKAWQPSTYDNPYLTEDDLRRFEVQVGNNPELIEQYLKGKKPIGNGKHFSRATLEAMRDPTLDEQMTLGLKNQADTNQNMGYVRLLAQGVGIHEWLLPYEPNRKYVVISDPGTENPPHRDSPPIMIWDITDFPKLPAQLVGFCWVFGNRSIRNWSTRYQEMVARYKAYGCNGFDATGYQSGYDQLMIAIDKLMPEKISLSGNNKAAMLNAAKSLTARQMIKVPVELSHIYDQLSRYEFPPEPKHIRQDLVMCFIMSCWYFLRYYYIVEEGVDENPYYNPYDRYARTEPDRYGDHTR